MLEEQTGGGGGGEATDTFLTTCKQERGTALHWAASNGHTEHKTFTGVLTGVQAGIYINGMVYIFVNSCASSTPC